MSSETERNFISASEAIHLVQEEADLSNRQLFGAALGESAASCVTCPNLSVTRDESGLKGECRAKFDNSAEQTIPSDCAALEATLVDAKNGKYIDSVPVHIRTKADSIMDNANLTGERPYRSAKKSDE